MSTKTIHLYVSTYCQHELHEDCRLECKMCKSPCLCPCHRPIIKSKADGTTLVLE